MRVGMDIDGVVADFATAFDLVVAKVCGPASEPPPSDVSAGESASRRLLSTRDMDAVWTAIRDVKDWWTSLAPCEPDALPRLYTLSRQRGWTVFFVTNRPATAGRPVQAQTQEWLERQGFPGACVIPLTRPRHEIVGPLELDALVDDRLEAVLNVDAQSGCQAILVDRAPEAGLSARLRAHRVRLARSLDEGLDMLTEIDRTSNGRTPVQFLREWLRAIGRRS